MTIPAATNTKWWVRRVPSLTPTSILDQKVMMGTAVLPALSEKCPSFAADFKPGTYGYISVLPPYENLIRSGPGKNYFGVGYIEPGGWVKVLDFPVCADDNYVWLKVESAGSSGGWTAGGRRNTQWVILCPDPEKKCTLMKQTRLPALTPKPGRADLCASNELAVGLDAQVSLDDLLVVRTEPYVGGVLGHISPASVVTIIEGPKCEGSVVWWKVTCGQLTGWAVENLLKPCPKEGTCKAWN